MKIIHVVGARPNFMKIAPIVAAINAHSQDREAGRPAMEQILVHTGQHYDEAMSALFFKELGIPEPNINLEVGSSSHAQQTAEIMKRFEPVCLEHQPTHVLLVGDVNSTIACALVAAKLGIKVIHVEAGLRSFDRAMPEEINRILTDAISDLLFITERSAAENLRQEGVAAEKIHFVGNVMIDTLVKHLARARQSDILQRLGLAVAMPGAEAKGAKPYGVVTLHRPSNVDNRPIFQGILEALQTIGRTLPILFPVHPRTLNRARDFGLQHLLTPLSPTSAAGDGLQPGVYTTTPLGYLDFLQLTANAAVVLTDSGGIQEETTILGVPCVTLRENTERPITISQGTNVLAGTDKEKIIQLAGRCLLEQSRSAAPPKPELWDGHAAERIVHILLQSEISS